MLRTEKEAHQDHYDESKTGIRAVCRIPMTNAGRTEMLEQVEALFPQKSSTMADAGSAGPRPVLGSIFPFRIGALLRPRDGTRPDVWMRRTGALPLRRKTSGAPLSGAQLPGLHVIICESPPSCEIGFEWDEYYGVCIGEGNWTGAPNPAPPAPPPPGGSAPGNGTNPPPPPPPTTPQFTLACPDAMRGAEGTCSVSAPGVDLGELVFAWSSSTGSSVAPTRGERSWTGIATSDVEVTVTISDTAGAIQDTRKDSANVVARSWSFGLASGRPVYRAPPDGWTDSNKNWGSHGWGVLPAPATVAGTGPWDKTHIGGGLWPLADTIYLHPDFDSTGVAYPTATVSASQCAGAGLLNASENVLGVNAGCSTLAALQSWETAVTAHEQQHRSGLVNCLGSAWARVRIDSLEAVSEASAYDVVRAFNDAWGTLEQQFNLAAETTLSTPLSPQLWEHRQNSSWTLHSLQPSAHSGIGAC